ncbi:hypothetical protein ABT099_23355 [Streptomyces prasinus]|uniref:hypothetical protein n=1 Tax=Streptomyces prasinus TaxID=67345 RepID=UPI0033318564
MRSAFRTHHRTEIRRLKTAAFARLDHPDARRTLQVVRWGKNSTTGKLTVERLSPITGLPPGAATGARLAAWTRGHWKIENLLRPVRDRTFREDDSKVHAGRLPASRPACATSPSAFTAGTAPPASPPPCATPSTTAARP